MGIFREFFSKRSLFALAVFSLSTLAQASDGIEAGGPQWVKGRLIISSKKGLRKNSISIASSPSLNRLEKRIRASFKNVKKKPSPLNSQVLTLEVKELESRPIEETLSLLKRFQTEPDLVVEPDLLVKTQEVPTSNDRYFPPASGAWGQSFLDQWPLLKLNVPEAWKTSKGSGVLIAVIDTGVDYNHPELTGKVINGYDFSSQDNDSMDENGHGTHVAGTIAATLNNRIGIAGIAPEARILGIKVLSREGYGTLSAVAEGIIYAVQNGARVINLSLGSPGEAPQYLLNALDFAQERDVLVVAAAGNSRSNVREFTPAGDPSVVAVAATNSNDERASFSNYGNRIALAAPGGGDTEGGRESILSLKSKNLSEDLLSLVVGEHYLRLAGTSMAAPHVAAVAGLLRSQFPQYTSHQIRQMLVLGTDDIGEPGFDVLTGQGRINAQKALAVLSPLEVYLSQRKFLVTDSDSLEIFGKVQGTNLKGWELVFGNHMVGNRETVVEGVQAQDGLLTRWDLAAVADGDYFLELVATDEADRRFSFRSDISISRNKLLKPELKPGSKAAVIQSINHRSFIQAQIAPHAVKTELRIMNSIYEDISHRGRILKNGINTDTFEAEWDTSNLPAGAYYISVFVYHPGGAISSLERWTVFDPSLKVGWPFSIPYTAFGSFRFGFMDKNKAVDFEGKGRASLFFDHEGKEFVLGSDAKPLSGWPISKESEFSTSSASGDVNGDGIAEIVSCDRKKVTIHNKAGTLLKTWLLNLPAKGTLAQKTMLLDLDSDGKKEILCPIGNRIDAFNFEGDQIPGWPVTFQSFDMGATQMAAINFLNQKAGLYVFEPRTETNPMTLHAIDGNGQELPGWPQLLDYEPFKSSSILFALNGFLSADMNQDGVSDLVLYNHQVIQIYDHLGKVLPGWPQEAQSDSELFLGLAVGDIDGDGWSEVVTSLNPQREHPGLRYFIQAYRKSGEVLSGFPLSIFSPARRGAGGEGLALADLDGDGRQDITGIGTRNSDGFTISVHALNYLGQEIPGFPKLMADGIDGPGVPAVIDLDGDGSLELVMTDEFLSIYAWELKSKSNALTAWNMANGDAARSSSVPLINAPGHPTSVLGKPGALEIQLSWEAPLSPGGSPIKDYLIRYSIDRGKTWILYRDGVSSVTHTIVSGLRNGASYEFQVAAINEKAQGAFSPASPIVRPHRRPSAPGKPVGRSLHRAVSLSWTAPQKSGIPPVTDYVIQVSSDGGRNWGRVPEGVSTRTQTQINGLRNDRSYIFRVAAMNREGQSDFSEVSMAIQPKSQVPSMKRANGQR